MRKGGMSPLFLLKNAVSPFVVRHGAGKRAVRMLKKKTGVFS